MSENRKPTDWTGIGIGIYAITVGMAGWHMAWQGTLGLPIYLAIALFGGSMGGIIMARDFRSAGLLSGLVGSVGSFAAVYFFHVNQSEVSNVSIALAVLVGALPGLGLYHILKAIRPHQGPPNDSRSAKTKRRRQHGWHRLRQASGLDPGCANQQQCCSRHLIRDQVAGTVVQTLFR